MKRSLIVAGVLALLLVVVLPLWRGMRAQEAPQVEIEGVVTDMDLTEGWILVDVAGAQPLQLNVNADTRCYDGDAAISLSDIRIGDSVRARHDEATTMSLPPQSYCTMLVRGVAAGDGAAEVTG